MVLLGNMSSGIQSQTERVQQLCTFWLIVHYIGCEANRIKDSVIMPRDISRFQ